MKNNLSTQAHDVLSHLYPNIEELIKIRSLCHDDSDRLIQEVYGLSFTKLEYRDKTILLSAINTHILQRELTHGPLNKTIASFELEALILALSESEKKNIQFNTTIFNDYELNINGTTYNVSSLLRNANLAHIKIADETIDKLVSLTTQLQKQKLPEKVRQANKDLNIQIKTAIYLYTGKNVFSNLNRLFRNEVVYNLNLSNILELLIIGLLINEGLQHFQRVSYPDKHGIKALIRKDDLPLEELKDRANSPLRFTDAFFSLSKNKKAYIPPGYVNTETFFRGSDICAGLDITSLSKYSMESEFLLPPSTQVLYEFTESGVSINAKVVNSPLLGDVKDDFTAEVMLLNYYKQFPNTENTHRMMMSAYRKMQYIELLRYYFANHAKQHPFKVFCQDLKKADIEYLKIAILVKQFGKKDSHNKNDNIKKFYQKILWYADNLEQLANYEEPDIKLSQQQKQDRTDLLRIAENMQQLSKKYTASKGPFDKNRNFAKLRHGFKGAVPPFFALRPVKTQNMATKSLSSVATKALKGLSYTLKVTKPRI